MRKELADSSVKTFECRRLEEAWAALAGTNTAFLIAEANSGNLSDLVERLKWLRRDFPHARAAVVADRSLADREWLMREAGAIHFLTSPRELSPLTKLVVRHLANLPQATQTVAEQIWGSLPWTRYST